MQSQTITFPISFPKSCYHVTWMAISTVTNAYKASGYVNSVTRNSFYVTADNINCQKYWLAIGVQQWGLINAEKTAIAFPVAFPLFCFAISITAVYANQAWSYPVVAQSITRSSFVARTQSNWRADDTARYIAVGMQQCFKRCAFGKAQALHTAIQAYGDGP